MLDYKIALALTEHTVACLKEGEDRDIIIDREKKNKIRTIETPDGNYKILTWDWEPDARMNDAYTHLLETIKSVRHALIEITEDGNIFTDIEPEDNDGYDGVFEDILGWNTQIVLWNDPDDVLV